MTPTLGAPRRPVLPILLLGVIALAPATRPSDASRAAEKREAILRANNLGIALLAQFKPAEAEKQFREAVTLDPAYVPGHVNAGIAALAQVHYDDAIAAFTRALALSPDNIHARFNLSLIYKLQGKAAEALAEAQRASALDPRDADIRYHVGSLYMAQRDFPKAIAEFDTVLKLDPNFLSAYYSLGRAYIASGDAEKGRRFMEKHRELQQGAGATPAVGLRYGEQGRYSYAMEDTAGSGGAPPLAQGAVVFAEVTAATGIQFTHGGAGGFDALRAASRPAAGSPRPLEEGLAPLLGSGIAVADVDGDGKEDLFFANASADGRALSSLWLNRGGMRFAAAPSGPAVGGVGMGAAFGDLDGDGDPDLAIASLGRLNLFVNDGGAKFREITADCGIGTATPKGLPGGVSLSDVDHDGDLDLFVAGFLAAPSAGGAPPVFPGSWPSGQPLLFLNATGPATEAGPAPIRFTEATGKARIALSVRRSAGAVFTDFDNDRDVDVAVASLGEGSTVYSNQRDGTFADLASASGLPAGAPLLGLAAADYDKDGWVDLAATTWDGGLPRLFRNMKGTLTAATAERGGALFAADVVAMAEVPRQLALPQFGVAFLDFDNDGFLDLLTVNGAAMGPALFVYHNLGGGRFEEVGGMTGMAAIPARSGRALASADLDADGDLDVVIGNAGGAPTILRNDGGNTHHWIRVAPAGLHSNRPGVGTKVEIKSGALWQKVELTAGSGYLSQSSLIPHFGLGQRARVDTLRLLWPGGVLQDEVQVKADAQLAVQELDRKGSSCPILYAWNGSAIAFVSDFLGGSALGYRTGPDSFNYPDTEEYVGIRPEQLKPRDGALDLRMVNQLEETIYFDRARLLAVDHPAGIEIFPDERLMPAAPYPPFRLFAVASSRPLNAWDASGGDVTPALAAVDRRYAGPAAEPPARSSRRYKGYAAEHRLTLDLGERAGDGASVLLLHGWIDYADSTSNVAAAQAGLPLISPYLEAFDESGADGLQETLLPNGETRRGRWVRASDAIGFPAGLPKTMTVDLDGLIPKTARFIRIGTSMRIYWDRIRLATRLAPAPPMTALESSTATLRYRGFPALTSPDGAPPELYDYARDQQSVHWMSHAGAYTRYGEVRDLLLAADDRYVITRPGDEIALRFDAAGLPPLPPGYERSWLLQTSGFGKDMDINSARPDTVGPLPFHAMKRYPPGAGELYPYDDPLHQEYLDLYNTRIVPSPLPPIAPRNGTSTVDAAPPSE